MAKSDDKPFQHVTIPLTGRLKTSVDPINLDDGDFQSLVNMRYTDRSVRTVQGQTKINTTAVPKPVLRSAFQFKKEAPVAENHILVQGFSADGTTSGLYVNNTTPPATGEFSTAAKYIRDDASGAGIARFTFAPGQAMVACNGKETLVWGGDEMRIGAYIDCDLTANSYKYNYTDKIINTDPSQLATIHRYSRPSGLTDTVTLLHFDNNVTDSETTPKTFTPINAPSYSTTSKFGTHSISLNGTNQYLTTPDHDDFDFSGGAWTIDWWQKTTALSGTIYNHMTGSNDQIKIYWKSAIGRRFLTLEIWAAGVLVVEMVAQSYGQTSLNNFTHFAVCEDGDNYYMFQNGTLIASTTSTGRPGHYAGAFASPHIGSSYGGYDYAFGLFDEFRISKVTRWIAPFTPLTVAYGSSQNVTQILLASQMPVRGVKPYIVTANTSAGALAVYSWAGGGAEWAAVAGLTDGTAVTGKPLAQTGLISFDDTSTWAKPKYIDGMYAYWVLLEFTEVDVTTTINYVTLDTAIQPINDLWDGIQRNIASFRQYTISSAQYADYTLNVYKNAYVPSDASTYYDASNISTDKYIYVGFNERSVGIYLSIDGGYPNTAINTNVSVDYFNGKEFISVGSVQDDTAAGTVSLSGSGAITWNDPGESAEFISNLPNLKKGKSDITQYIYRLKWTGDPNGGRIYNVTGIPAQKPIKGYSYPVAWQNRVWLLGETSGKKNSVRSSAYGSMAVFNGSDSMNFNIGDDSAVVCGGGMSNRFGGAITDVMVMCKNNETWVIDGSLLAQGAISPTFGVYAVSSNHGCPAPGTFCVCNVGYEISPGINKHVAIWMASTGVVIYDNNAILPISEDIKGYWEPWDANFVNTALFDRFCADYDPIAREYHLFIATGSSTTLNVELVYDLYRKKWFTVDRGTKKVNGTVAITDSTGYRHNYGFDSSGLMYHMENGTTFDGVAITASLKTKTIVFGGPLHQSEIRKLRVMTKAKNATANKIAITHYADTSSTASTPAIAALSVADTGGKRIASTDTRGIRSGAWGPCSCHEIELSMTTSNESIGFEPIAVGVMYKIIREDMGG